MGMANVDGQSPPVLVVVKPDKQVGETSSLSAPITFFSALAAFFAR
jgi:hypothetical protein